MIKTIVKRISVLFFLALCMRPLQAAEPAPLQRYGIIIGINEGGPSRSTLKFAATDAEAFACVMQEMGGLGAGRRILLLNPALDEITRAFADMKKKLLAEKESYRRQEFILYYSGHSDEAGLLIGGNRLPYQNLRTLVSGIPSDVRIAVIDSCASGVFIRLKGGVQKPPFMIDAAADMKGYAFLTSSSETEAAQESDHIEGSFFTHYLVSGLRGAADATKDGVVTLNEAYHFAFSETLVRTEKTQFGPQHPSYDIQLSGTGDLVLTDLRETSAGLVIAEEITGRIFIRNIRGKLVVELNKQERATLEIGLAPGTYAVLVDADNRLRRAEVRLTDGRRTALAAGDLAAVKSERTARRGPDDPEAALDEPDEALTAHAGIETDVTDAATPQERFKAFRVTIFPNGGADEGPEVVVVNSVVFNLTVGEAQRVTGVELSLIGGIVERDLTGFQAAGIFNIAGGDVRYFQGASVFNITNGRLDGFQGACVFNITDGRVAGVQLACAFNIAGGGVIGAQLAAAFNIASESVQGVQASVVNIGEDVSGAQVGVVNIAGKVNGVQIGIVNIAEDNEGLALGLFSYSRNGIHNLELWHGTDGYSHAAFKFGTKYFYTIVLGGYNFSAAEHEYCFGLGWGGHLPIGNFFIDLDAYVTSRRQPDAVWTDEPILNTLLPQVRLKAGLKLFDGFSLFAGVDFQFFIPYMYYDPALTANYLFEIPIQDSTETCKVVPAFFFGVQIF